MPVVDSPRVGLRSEAEVLDWAHRVMGPMNPLDDLSFPSSTHRVLTLTTRNDDPVVVKWFHDAPCFFRTVDALNLSATALGHHTPHLIAQHESLRAVVMTALPGRPPGSDEMLDPTLHFRLGRVLKQLHEAAPANPSTVVPKAWATELSGLCDRHEDTIGETLAQEMRSLALGLLDAGQVSLSPTHGSLSPEHILIDPDRGLQMVGFSRSEYDPWVVDIVALQSQWWAYSPDLESAFFTGYERALAETDRLFLRAKYLIDSFAQWEDTHSRKSAKGEQTRSRRDLDSALGETLF
jgi:hypothetical protein